MKKFPWVHIFAALGIIACSAAVLAVGNSLITKETEKPSPVQELSLSESISSAAPAAEPLNAPVQKGYILKSHEGYVCVFSPGGALLWRTDISIERLRNVDAQALDGGIIAASIEQVWQLLEDFGS